MEPLAVTTFIYELLFKAGDLPVQQVIGLVDQANEGIGGDGRVAVSEQGFISFMIGPIGQIRLIGPISFYPHLPYRFCLRIVLPPEWQFALAQEILVIQQLL